MTYEKSRINFNTFNNVKIDRRQLSEYPFDGVFYEYKDDNSGGLLNTQVEEVEVLRVKCDIQQTSLLGNAGFLASSYTIFFPLEANISLIEKEGNEVTEENAEEPLPPSQTELIDDTSYKPVVIKRGMYFKGSIYGYEVNGKVIGVAPSMLGGCACQIKDLDE